MHEDLKARNILAIQKYGSIRFPGLGKSSRK